MSTKFAKTAFVIMPFADEYKASFDDIIKPAINNIGLNCIRADIQ